MFGLSGTSWFSGTGTVAHSSRSIAAAASGFVATKAGSQSPHVTVAPRLCAGVYFGGEQADTVTTAAAIIAAAAMRAVFNAEPGDQR